MATSREPAARTSADPNAERVAQLKALFPEAFADGRLDPDRLRASLGDQVAAGPERFTFTWAGRADAAAVLQTPTRATLIPKPSESVNFDTTKNLFIEGDNLEVLKLLYKPYHGRVKLIYIDPPYNTGQDFIYPDDFRDTLANYLALTAQVDAAGNLLRSNPETSGRHHSDWLSMMWPRLFLARQLLRDNGVIFVSIDDHEVHHLRMLMNEIFGEENFVGCIVRGTGQTTGQDSTGLGTSFDYALVYCRDSAEYAVEGLPLSGKDLARFDNEDKKGRYCLWQLRKTGSNDRREDRPNLYYAILAPDGTEVYPIGPGGYESNWRFGKPQFGKMVEEGLIEWKKVDRNGASTWWPYVKQYLEGSMKRPSPLWTDLEGSKKATLEMKEVFDDKVFNNPKPTDLIRRMLQISTYSNNEEIVLDFFAGSGTTAQAVLRQNNEDGGNRRFILVQLPEPTGNKKYPTIAEIGKDRVRRVIAKLSAETRSLTRTEPEDLGFKVFKLAESHFAGWSGVDDRSPEAYQRELRLIAEEPLRKGWTPTGLLWEVAVKEGYGLNSTIDTVPVSGATVYRVTDPERGQHFMACVDDTMPSDICKQLGLTADDLLIVRDAALDDTLAANLALQCRLKTI